MQYKFLDILFSFFCRSSFVNKEGLSPIVLRISYLGARKDLFTGLRCHLPNWNNEGQRVTSKEKQADQINNNLDEIKYKCKEVFERLKYEGTPFTLDQLVIQIKGGDDMPTTIIGYLNHKTAELKERVGIDITNATLQKYERCIKHVREFLYEKYKNKDIAIASITGKLLSDFFYFLRTKKSNGHNTSVNYIKCLKTVLMPAIKNRILPNDPFIGLKIAPKQVMRGFLTIEEIRKIENVTELSASQCLVKDIFLFSCYTGMAYSDVKQFKSIHIKKDSDGSVSIHKPRQKTGILSIIPLLPPAIKILERYSPTNDFIQFKWHVPPNQSINRNLKEICNLAGIQQNIFFHLARHTFATTITLSNGVPLETVSRMLGHSDIKMTQRYAKISGYKIKKDMERLMEMF